MLSLVPELADRAGLMFVLAVIFLRDETRIYDRVILSGLARCIARCGVEPAGEGDINMLRRWSRLFAVPDLVFSVALVFRPSCRRCWVEGRLIAIDTWMISEAVLIYLGIPFLAGS